MTMQYKEVKRKANVGERIRIVAPEMALGKYQRGSEFVVMEVNRNNSGHVDRVHVGDFTLAILDREYVVLEPIESASLPEMFESFLRENAAAVRKYLDEIAPAFSVDSSGGVTAKSVAVSKPLTRADEKLDRGAIIEKAKADVAELTKKMRSFDRQHEGNYTFQQVNTRPEFHVNRNKRAVTVLVRKHNDGVGYKDGEILERGFAYCAPGDVFHAEIGKAIALRKALGLTIPDEYLNAPQPDEPRAGAKVRKLTGYNVGTTLTLEKRTPWNDGEGYGNYAFSTVEGSWIADKQYEVIDDTDVDYSASGSEVAA